MRRLLHVSPAPGDLVAVALPPGPQWPELVGEVWEAGAALMPVDHRLPTPEVDSIIARARPTVLLGSDGPSRIEAGEPVADGVALVVHTSGTQGEPKLAQFERGAVDAAVASTALALDATGEDPWLCCLPVAHVAGLLVLLRGVLLGAPVAVHPAFDPVAVAAEDPVAFTSVVPTMLERLLDAEVDLARFTAILVGGAPLHPDLRGRAEEVGCRVVETYGLTESCGGVVYDGRALPGSLTRLDPDGEVQLTGPTLMFGFRLDDRATRAALTSDGWLRTGDAGRIDGDGRLHVIGRMDELILTGGENVWPQEVEAALRGHAKVREVAVGGRPDPEWGQRVVAWVVPARATDPPTLGDLRGFAGSLIARHKLPHELVLVAELPRTPSGKVRRKALVDARPSALHATRGGPE